MPSASPRSPRSATAPMVTSHSLSAPIAGALTARMSSRPRKVRSCSGSSKTPSSANNSARASLSSRFQASQMACSDSVGVMAVSLRG